MPEEKRTHTKVTKEHKETLQPFEVIHQSLSNGNSPQLVKKSCTKNGIDRHYKVVSPVGEDIETAALIVDNQ